MQAAGSLTCDYLASVGDVSALGYDAIEPKGRRRAPTGINHSEDAILKQRGRDLITSQAKDVHRNFAIARWAINKHLDYTTQFEFQAAAGEEYGTFDDDLEAWVAEKAQEAKFDVARRHCLDRFLRIAECRNVLEGDIGVMQLATGQVQAIESDRIRNPENADERWTNGVRTVDGGAAIAYGIWDRKPKGHGYVWNRSVPAGRFHLHGSWDRFDQVRGVSPFNCALNSFQDIYEGIDYTLAKMKVESLFAMKITRKADTTGAPFSDEPSGIGGTRRKYTVDFGRGPIVMDMDEGDDAGFLKSDTPGANSREFLMAIIMIGLKAVDIPFSFFDESFTNFFGSRSAWLHYDRSCQSKLANNAALLNWWIRWRIQLGVQDRELRLPRGLSLRKSFWEWVPNGMPWWDPVKEINGDNQAIMAGFTDPETVCKKRNQGSWFKNIDKRARCEKYATERGIKVSWDMQPIQEVTVNNDT